MTDKLSPAQRRKAAVGVAFQKWYLTDGMTSAAAHITAGHRALAELAEIRAGIRSGRVPRSKRAIYIKSAVQSARFNLAIGRRSSRLP